MLVNVLRSGCNRSRLFPGLPSLFRAVGPSLRHSSWTVWSPRIYAWTEINTRNSRCFSIFPNSAIRLTRLDSHPVRNVSNSSSNASTAATGSESNLTPVEESQKSPKVKLKSTDVKRLLEFAKPERWNIAGGVSCLVLSSAITMSVPFGLGKILDAIYATSSETGIAKEKLDQFCMLLAGIFLLGGLANFGRVYLFSNASLRITRDIRAKVYSSMLNQEAGWFDQKGTGELVNRLSSDTYQVGNSLSMNLSDGLRSTAMIMAGTGMMVYTSPHLALVGMCIVPCVAGMAVFYGRFVRNITKEVMDKYAEIMKVGRESPSSTPPSANPAYRIETPDFASSRDGFQQTGKEDDSETSYTYAQFQKTGKLTAPATVIPRFRKYNVDDFHFLTVLGKGSFGKVFLAELRNTEYYYAVKCLKKDVVLEDDDVDCTLIERKVLALGTKHPFLCHLFCTFQTDSHLFFVMEYLNGGDLMFHIQQSGRFQEARARFYAAEIVSGLKFLHRKGIVYRDLKLDNVLLDYDGHVRIADFGMCKLEIYLDRLADSFCGTPDYMAPEIIKGQKYNQAVDWWSFGVLVYEMLVGQSPFSGCDEDELFWSICNEIPWFPHFLSKDALKLLQSLLEKDATIRLGCFNSMDEDSDLKYHPFFESIDWQKLERRGLEPPFKPQVRHPLDTQYFDKQFTRERARLTPIDRNILASMNQGQFEGFTYTNPNNTLT